MRPLSGASARSGHVGLGLKKAAGTTEVSQMVALDGEHVLVAGRTGGVDIRVTSTAIAKASPVLNISLDD